jgi:hypothetical protein
VSLPERAIGDLVLDDAHGNRVAADAAVALAGVERGPVRALGVALEIGQRAI